MKEFKGFRLSADVIAILTTYMEEHKLKNLTEALEAYVLRRPEASIEVCTDKEDNPCNLRIKYLNSYYCVNRPPKAVKLLTLDICAVCKVRQFGLPEKTLIIESKAADPAPTKFSNAKPYIPKRLYCPMTTDFVDRQAICSRCHAANYQTWLKCKSRLEQEARER